MFEAIFGGSLFVIVCIFVYWINKPEKNKPLAKCHRRLVAHDWSRWGELIIADAHSPHDYQDRSCFQCGRMERRYL